ncbi:CDGSH iron-sulfur domain-containing protein 3, mitochondrial isoform X2 [Kogia breviceps]|uniref:CDGSH iron-sulfur domain-containing protein 3, mitochondrial isoform X2 n=1 Tax=Kogia breviceps TaxID=27615 RepID=UPI0034D1D2B2
MLRAGHSQTRGNQRGRRRALHTPGPPRRLRGLLLGPTSGGWGWSACAGPRPAPREPRSVFRAEAGPGRREAGKREGDRGARRSRRGGGSGAGMGGAGALLRPAALKLNQRRDITSWLARWFPQTPAKSVVALKTPIKVELVAGKTYRWCVCGHSKKQEASGSKVPRPWTPTLGRLCTASLALCAPSWHLLLKTLPQFL